MKIHASMLKIGNRLSATHHVNRPSLCLHHPLSPRKEPWTFKGIDRSNQKGNYPAVWKRIFEEEGGALIHTLTLTHAEASIQNQEADYYMNDLAQSKHTRK